MDGFSFFHFNDRFIGAQSGNVIQAGINIAKGDFARFGILQFRLSSLY